MSARNGGIERVDLDLGKSCRPQNLQQIVPSLEFEGCLVDWDIEPRGLQGNEIEFIFVQRSPAHEGKSATAPAEAAKIAKGGNGVVKGHDAEPGIDAVCHRARQGKGGCVSLYKLNLGEGGGSQSCKSENARRNVDTNDAARRPDPARELLNGLASPTADIDNDLSGLGGEPIHRGQAEGRQLQIQEIRHFTPGVVRQFQR